MTAAARPVPLSVMAFQGHRAGVVTRAAGATIDGLVAVTAVLFGYAFVIGIVFLWNPRNFRAPVPGFGVLLLITAAVLAVYLTACWALTGRSWGGQVLGLRLIDRRGHVPSLSLAALRAVCCVLVPLGLFWTVVDRRSRSLQDLVLGTSVVYDWDFDRG